MLTALAVAAVAAAGIWQGTLERDGAPLEVEVAITERGDELQGRFSAAQLRAVGIPLTRVQARDDTVGWQLVGDRTTMVVEGKVAGDALTGTFTEGDARGTLRLRRASVSRFAAREEEIAFESADHVVLAGTILRPAGPGPFPGIVFLHGSGPEGRWGSRYLAHEFVNAGFAALIFDKRGVGGSKGDWRTAGFEQLVADSAAAVDALRARKDVAKVGIHGHSQGGTYAPWVAVMNPNVAFVIASAASGVTMADAEVYSVANAMKIWSLPEEDRELAGRFVRALVASAYQGAPRSEVEKIRREAEGKPWLIPVPPESSPYWAFSRSIASYDPMQYWSQVRVPVLLVYGESDERVPVQASISRITAALPPGTTYTSKVFPEADHGFRVRSKAAGFAWPQSASGYPESIVEWARRVAAL